MRKTILLSLTFFCITIGISAQFNMTLYQKLPSLYKFDNYDYCLHREQNTEQIGQYCMVYAEILPNTTSNLWKYISEISADKRHFRHDIVFRGMCVEHCKKLFHSLNQLNEDQSYINRVKVTQIAAYYRNVHKRFSDEHSKLERMINSCLNNEFQNEYNLSLLTNIEYCEKTGIYLEHGWIDVSFYTFLVLIIIFTVLSTFWDFMQKSKQPFGQQNNTFYKKDLRSRNLRLLTAFSLCRNYYQLISNSDNLMRVEVKGLNLLRVLGTFLVIFSHALLLVMALPIENPEFFERFFYRFEAIIIENGVPIIQIFFVMSGFLLYVNFTTKILVNSGTSIKRCIGVYFKVFGYRYLRLIPSLIIVIAFNATILVRLQDGPYWRHLTEAEHIFCLENWWKNLLFVNNYMMEESCMHQTWYLAADMQLFELFLILLITTAKYPQLKKYVVCLMFALSVLVPSFLVYHLNLDPIYRSYPETYRYMFFKDSPTFHHTYTPFYTYIGSYLCGVLSGELYLSCVRNTQLYNKIAKHNLAWWLIFPVGFGLVLFAELFMSDSFEKPSLWIAAFSGLYKCVWALICSLLLLGLCFKCTWLLYEISHLQIFNVLAKASYQSFLWHGVVLRLLVGFYRRPLYVNKLYMTWIIAAAFILTQILSLLLTLIVEIPITRIIKCCFGDLKERPAKTTIQDVVNENLPLN